MSYQPTDVMYQGAFLPHTEANGRPMMITFHLGDAIPQEAYNRLAAEASTPEQAQALAEKYLDKGRGKCWLERDDIGILVADAVRFYHKKSYHLIDWVIMPNHVHLVYDQPKLPMGKIVRRLKSYTARQANKILGRTGESFWQRDFFDRYARDPLHLYNMSCYTALNPVKAGLVDDPFDWKASSIHDYHPDFKEDLRRWYKRYRQRFWENLFD